MKPAPRGDSKNPAKQPLNIPEIQDTRLEQYKKLVPTLLLLGLVGGCIIGGIEYVWPNRDNRNIDGTVLTGCIIFLQVKLYTLHVNSRLQGLLQTTGLAQKAIGYILGLEEGRKQEILSKLEIEQTQAQQVAAILQSTEKK